MKSYFMIGNNIGIEIHANSAQEAIQEAESKLLQGLGGDITFCNEEDQQEYEEESRWQTQEEN
jgi:hypothetical protein